MRKIGFITVVLLGFMYSVNAQDISSNAIGLRFGDNDGFGAEISYQHKIKDSNRLEFDLGFRDNKNFDIWKLTGVYQWIWNVDGGFNWYAGFGAGIGNVDVKGFDNDDGIFVNAAGNVGVEYNFEIPLLISLDFRPEFGIVNDFGDDDLGVDIALSLRYQF
jgi:opacity protein-like surface antigen